VCDIIRRELGSRVAFAPEAATLLFDGGFPRYSELAAAVAQQRAIFAVQRSLEDAQLAHYSNRILLCDRGTVDGAAYWPENSGDYFTAMNTTIEQEYKRYDGVIFMESAAVSNLAINASMLEGGNVHRNENLQEAARLDAKLKQLWQGHRNFFVVKSSESFFSKVVESVRVFKELLQKLEENPNLSQDLCSQ